MGEDFEDDVYLEYEEDIYEKMQIVEEDFENKMRLYDDIEEAQFQIKELETENNKLNLIINKMAEFIDEIDIKQTHCLGLWCTVATTCYPEEERKKICIDCIKRTFRENL